MPSRRPPTAAELLRAVAIARGWSAANGLPDETRAGRTLLKDFTSGKLLHARWPPGQQNHGREDAPPAQEGMLQAP